MILDDLAACSDKVREFAKDAHVIRVPFRVCPFTVKESRERQFVLSLIATEERIPEGLLPLRDNEQILDASMARAPYKKIILVGDRAEDGIVLVDELTEDLWDPGLLGAGEHGGRYRSRAAPRGPGTGRVSSPSRARPRGPSAASPFTRHPTTCRSPRALLHSRRSTTDRAWPYPPVHCSSSGAPGSSIARLRSGDAYGSGFRAVPAVPHS